MRQALLLATMPATAQNLKQRLDTFPPHQHRRQTHQLLQQHQMLNQLNRRK